MTKKSGDEDEVRFIESGDARTSEPSFVNDEEIADVARTASANKERWSRFPGQFGGLAKVDSGFDYAASFSSSACVA